MGLLFGVFAGAGFYAVQQGMNAMNKNDSSTAAVESAVSGDATALTDDGSQAVFTEGSVSNISYVSSDVSEVVEQVMPAMVSIINNYTETSNFWGRVYSEDVQASGSGIIVADTDDELLIVTNNHVVEDANSLEITFIDGSTAEAKIKGTDSDMDLAVIAVDVNDLSADTKAAITVASLGDSDELKLGEPVIAIGNALGYGQSVTNGIISALNREIEMDDGSTGTFIQTNAAINPGNSGGALLNIKGEVIGINSNKIGGTAIEGMGYAIPITSASPIIAELMERRTRSEKVATEDMGYIGIELQEVTSQISTTFNMPEGIYVVSTVDGGAAANAGIIKGDIITKFDGQKITSYTELQSVLQYYAAGETVSVTVMRPENGEYVAHEFELTLGSRPASDSK
jgi:serine protease Do